MAHTHTHTLLHSVLDICVYIYPDDHQSLWHANQKTRPADSALFSPNPQRGSEIGEGSGGENFGRWIGTTIIGNSCRKQAIMPLLTY